MIVPDRFRDHEQRCGEQHHQRQARFAGHLKFSGRGRSVAQAGAGSIDTGSSTLVYAKTARERQASSGRNVATLA